jgi:hypothetical protein
VSNTLSPIFSLFLAPAGTLYQKVQRFLIEEQSTHGNHPPVLKYRRPGPKRPTYGIPTSEWPTVVQRIVEQKEPLRTVAAAYDVSHETIRRIIRHMLKQRGQQDA